MGSMTRITGIAGSLAILFTVGLVLSNLSPVQAESEASLSKHGLSIAPVPLNLQGKNVELVGYGSYLVNAVSDCNGGHSQGPPTEYAPGGNPYFSQKPTKVNPATYLGGGRDFGPLIPGSADIVSRNLTPDKTGMAAGGHTFEEFRTILRTGVDPDKIHPPCAGAPNSGCIPAPLRRHTAANHAVARVHQHERPRYPRNLRIPELHPLHRRTGRTRQSPQRVPVKRSEHVIPE